VGRVHDQVLGAIRPGRGSRSGTDCTPDHVGGAAPSGGRPRITKAPAFLFLSKITGARSYRERTPVIYTGQILSIRIFQK
jgi:hypothetical protein